MPKAASSPAESGSAETGYFLEPTVIGDVPPDATIAQEEIFGPVLAVIKAKDFDDAMAIANNTEFGLTGSLYTTDEREHRARARATSSSATCTSTASARARW